MRRATLAALAATAAVACRTVLGLNNPIVEADDAGAPDAQARDGQAQDAQAQDAQDAHPGPDADNGAPSNTYPAFPQVPPPQIVSSPNGSVIEVPTLRCIAFAGDVLAGSIVEAGAPWLGSDLWTQQALGYGVAMGTAAPLVTVSETAPGVVTDAQIQIWLAAMLDGGHPELGPVDPGSLLDDLFVVFYPAGTSCKDFTGYHGELTVGAGRTTYVVVPRCSISASALGAASSYQILAAVTNPRPVLQPTYASFDQAHLAWNFLHGTGSANGTGPAEVPQPCKGLLLFPGDSGGALARSWSNTAAAEGHDPCVPTPDSGPYFASSPVLNDQVSLPGAYPTKGVQIDVGHSKTIEVQLWSDQPTSGPWTVDAQVMPGSGFAKDALTLGLDRPSGVNGEKLHLTITANQAGSIPFLLTSTLGSKQTFWVGIAGQK